MGQIYSNNTKNTLCPCVVKIPSKRKFGFVKGELRGTNLTKLINPPIEIEDNYYWIRDNTRYNPKVLQHIQNENEWTDYVMSSHKDLTKLLYREMKSCIRESYDSYPRLHNLKLNWKYFVRYYEGLDYHSHWRKITLSDGTVKEEELLNINLLAQGKSQCNVKSFNISPSHNYISYGVNYDGSEKYSIVLIDLTTHLQIQTPIPNLVYGSYFWVLDFQIYYLVGDDSNRLFQLWLWNMRTNLTVLIFEESNPHYDLSCELSEDEKFVFVSSGNYNSNWCGWIDLVNDPIKINYFMEMQPSVKYRVKSHDMNWYIHTNYNAINWQVMILDKSREPKWENLVQFIPPNNLVNISGFCVKEKFFVFKTKINGGVYLNVIDPDRNWVKILTHLENKIMSWNEYVNQDYSNYKSSLVYNIDLGHNPIYEAGTKLNIMFSSMISPKKLFDYDIETLESIQVHEQIVPNYKQELYESKRIWVEQEGTRLGIPVSLVYRKDLFKNDGSNPLYLYGYGSYGVTVNLDFNYEILPLLDRRYVYAIVHVRGGGFLGYDWYEDGKLNKKINTFNDFIKCTEYFKYSGMINPQRIVVEGRSAGGLLISACITMRPDLYWIGILIAPFVDVLNTMSDSTLPLTKEEWTQWGNPNEVDGFEYMSKYCPYTNVKFNVLYPHLYCTVGLYDPRVFYWEIIKLVAKIRENKTISNYQVLRIKSTFDHSSSSLLELAEKYSFIFTR